MKISREDVLKVAALANLELTDAEVETYRGQLDDILTYIDKLNEIDTSNVEPMAQVVAGPADDSALREDVVVRCGRDHRSAQRSARSGGTLLPRSPGD